MGFIKGFCKEVNQKVNLLTYFSRIDAGLRGVLKVMELSTISGNVKVTQVLSLLSASLPDRRNLPCEARHPEGAPLFHNMVYFLKYLLFITLNDS